MKYLTPVEIAKIREDSGVSDIPEQTLDPIDESVNVATAQLDQELLLENYRLNYANALVKKNYDKNKGDNYLQRVMKAFKKKA